MFLDHNNDYITKIVTPHTANIFIPRDDPNVDSLSSSEGFLLFNRLNDKRLLIVFVVSFSTVSGVKG